MKMRVLSAVLAAVVACGIAGNAFPATDIETVKKTLDGSLAKVSFYFKYDEGDAPGDHSSGGCIWLERLGLMSGSSGYDVDSEKPLVTAGFVLTGDTVLAEDPMLPDRFLDRIEVELGGRTYKAEMNGFATENRGVFLKLSERAANARPIIFDAKAAGPYLMATYGPGEDGEWRIQIAPLAEGTAVTEKGTKVVHAASPTLLVTAKGKVAGASMLDCRTLPERWKGSPLLWPQISAADFKARTEETKKASKAGIVQVTMNFRIKQSRRWDSSSWEERQTPTEKQTEGIVLGGGKVLVLTGLSRRQTAKIESMTVTCGDKSLPLTVEGAFAKYGALLAKYEGELPGAAPVPQLETDLAAVIEGLLIGDYVSYSTDTREERLRRERIAGIDEGYMGLLWPRIGGLVEDTFVFTLDGKLVAAPMVLRAQTQMQEYYSGEDDGRGSYLTVPVARLAAMLADPAALDASWKPLSEDDAKRLVWLGIETQGINKDLARAKNASHATKGGEVGVVVAYVYKGSPAEKAEVKSGDVLIRFTIPTQVKPVDVKMREEREMDFPWSQLDQVPDVYFEQMPRPWPSQDNSLTRFLTEVGAGKKVTAELVRDGQPRQVEFTLEFGPADYNAAASYEDKASGLTVKNITYEVRQYFKMKDDDPGVVVADIKRGSKASVAGIKPCEIITAVNGKQIANIDEFKNAISVGGEVSLTVKRMSQTRVAKIKLAAPGAKEEKKPEVKPAAPSEPKGPAPSTDSQLTAPAGAEAGEGENAEEGGGSKEESEAPATETE